MIDNMYRDELTASGIQCYAAEGKLLQEILQEIPAVCNESLLGTVVHLDR